MEKPPPAGSSPVRVPEASPRSNTPARDPQKEWRSNSGKNINISPPEQRGASPPDKDGVPGESSKADSPRVTRKGSLLDRFRGKKKEDKGDGKGSDSEPSPSRREGGGSSQDGASTDPGTSKEKDKIGKSPIRASSSGGSLAAPEAVPSAPLSPPPAASPMSARPTLPRTLPSSALPRSLAPAYPRLPAVRPPSPLRKRASYPERPRLAPVSPPVTSAESASPPATTKRNSDPVAFVPVAKRLSLPSLSAASIDRSSAPPAPLTPEAEDEKYRNKFMVPAEAKLALAEIAPDPTIRLPSRLADVVEIAEIDSLAGACVLFYAHHRRFFDVLRVEVKREIGNADGLSSVLRGNTLGPKLMSKYAKMAGGSAYLIETLVPHVTRVLATTRVWELGSGLRDSAPAAEATLQENAEALMHETSTFLDAIIASLPKIPKVFRTICKIIADAVHARFQDPTAVKGLGIKLDRKSPAQASGIKNLVLVSKLLQQLANGQQWKEKGGKNGLISDYLVAKRELFDQIVKAISEGAETQTVEEEQFQASDAELNSCVETFHSLLVKHGPQIVHELGQVQEVTVKVGDARFYKLQLQLNPSVWFRNVMYSDTVLDYFIHQSPFTRTPRIEHLMQFFSCPPVIASLLKLKAEAEPDVATSWLQAVLTFAEDVNPEFEKELAVWHVKIPLASEGRAQSWEEWIACKPPAPCEWPAIEAALRILVRAVLANNQALLAVLPLRARRQMVWLTWMEFLEGAYA